MPLLPPRPASYTPSDPICNNIMNNFDTVRSYGSAGDDLEAPVRLPNNLGPNFMNNRPVASVAPLVAPLSSHSNSDNDSINNKQWTDEIAENQKLWLPSPKQAYYDESKIQNGKLKNK